MIPRLQRNLKRRRKILEGTEQFRFSLQNGAEDFITYATLLEIHLEKVEFFSVEAQAAVLDGLLDIFLPVSEQKVCASSHQLLKERRMS